jgi:hypothetical protein
MKKKNIAFILFGLAGSNVIVAFLTFLIFSPLYERIGMPPSASRIALTSSFVIGVIAGITLLCSGLIVYIKFRKD